MSEQVDFKMKNSLKSPRRSFAERSSSLETPDVFIDRVSKVLSKKKLGEVLGKGTDFHAQALQHYLLQFDFTSFTVDVALRRFVDNFQLPGEAQQIDRIMSAFSKRYCDCNPNVFASPDAAYILSFSLIMLNTDLHNPRIKQKMTRSQFVRLNKSIEEGRVLSDSFLEELYDNIKNQKIDFPRDEEQNNSHGSLSENDQRTPKQSRWRWKPTRSSSKLSSGSSTTLSFDAHKSSAMRRMSSTESNPDLLRIAEGLSGDSSVDELVAPTAETGSPEHLIFAHGTLLKKNEHDESGKKVRSSRGWKPYFVILSDATLSLYNVSGGSKKTYEDYLRLSPAESINLHDAFCSSAYDYVKRKCVFRLSSLSGASRLFQAKTEMDVHTWIDMINFGAAWFSYGSADLGTREHLYQTRSEPNNFIEELDRRIKHYDGLMVGINRGLEKEVSVRMGMSRMVNLYDQDGIGGKWARSKAATMVHDWEQSVRRQTSDMKRYQSYISTMKARIKLVGVPNETSSEFPEVEDCSSNEEMSTPDSGQRPRAVLPVTSSTSDEFFVPHGSVSDSPKADLSQNSGISSSVVSDGELGSSGSQENTSFDIEGVEGIPYFYYKIG